MNLLAIAARAARTVADKLQCWLRRKEWDSWKAHALADTEGHPHYCGDCHKDVHMDPWDGYHGWHNQGCPYYSWPPPAIAEWVRPECRGGPNG